MPCRAATHDFGADALTKSLILAVIGRSVSTRAQLKGLSLATMGLFILGLPIRDAIAPELPRAESMGQSHGPMT